MTPSKPALAFTAALQITRTRRTSDAVLAFPSRSFLRISLRATSQRQLRTSFRACAPTSRVCVALTREQGKNESLRDALSDLDGVKCSELPCVDTVVGPDRPALDEALRDRRWSWVIITSPEAASVLCEAWEAVGRPTLRAAAVGSATAVALRGRGVDVAFLPQKATGQALVEEFSVASGTGEAVLYPSSALASGDVQRGLLRKGYDVLRLNTYSTEVSRWTQEQKMTARSVQIVTFAAPSAVRGWVQNAGVDSCLRVACIGETSSTAAISAGFNESKVFYPNMPGMDGWVASVNDAVHDIARELEHVN